LSNCPGRPLDIIVRPRSASKTSAVVGTALFPRSRRFGG
jgi:hypothetical protein